MSLITFPIWRHNVKLDKKWKLIGHRLLPVSISDPTVGESAQAIGIPRLNAQKALTTANTQGGFHACRSCAGVQKESNYGHRSPARLLARAFTAHRSLAHPKKTARVRLVQRGSRGRIGISIGLSVKFALAGLLPSRRLLPGIGITTFSSRQ